MDTVKISNKKEWSELADTILKRMLEETESVWVSAPPKEWLKKQASDIAEYRYKAEKFKLAGDLETARVYEDTMNMVVSQVEARAKEVEIHIKKGMLEFLKEAIKSTLKFSLSLVLPFP